MGKTISELKNIILDCLCRTPEIDTAMNEVLAMVGTYFHVDRAYVFENSKDDLCCSNTYEWCNKGVQPEMSHLQNLRYLEDLGGDFEKYYDENGLFFCRSLDDLSAPARAIVEPQHITSMLHCAIKVRGEFKGYIGFDNCSREKKGWETDQDAVDALVYTSHLLTLYLLDYQQKTDQLADEERKNRQKLQEANEMFSDLLTNVNCGVAIYDTFPDGRVSVAYMNEGLSVMMDCSLPQLKEAIGKDPFVIVEPSDREKVRQAFGAVRKGEKNAEVTCRGVSFQGNRIWIMLKLSGVVKGEGRTRIYGTFFDVTTERNTAEEIQKKYEVERQSSLRDSATLAFAVFNLSTEQVVEMERRPPLLPLEVPLSREDFFCDIEASILSKEEKREFSHIVEKKELLKGYEQGKDAYSIEFQRTLPTGKVIWVKSSFRLMMEPETSDVLLFYYCKDINLRKSLEIMTAYIANEDYDMIGCINFQDDSAIMLYGKNSSYDIEGQNIQKEESYTESLEWFVKHAIVPEERDKYKTQFFIERIKKELSLYHTYKFSVHVIGKKGERLTKEIRYTRYDAESEVCFFTQVDITQMLAEEEKRQQELREALRAAKQASDSKTEFFSRMSHDMRTPMNGILGMVDLSEEETDGKVLKQNLEKIKSSGEYLLGLINDTLDFQKIESGRLELEPEIVSAKDLFESITEMIQTSADEKGVNFQVVKKNVEFECYIRTDVLRMKQIFINLLSNATKFTPRGGTVEFRLELLERKGMLSREKITITDTGLGMSKDFLENRIFKPFAQEYNKTTAHYAGTGLGLSIAKKLLELMGGSITVESELGVGSKFTIDLTFERVEKSAYEKTVNEDEKRQNAILEDLAGKRILLAEDHPLNAEIAKKLLEKAGCEIFWAENGKDCVEQFEASKEDAFDAVLMDVRMPVLDGLEATRKLRGLPRKDARSVPIIAMTANAYEEDVRKCMDAGMNGHIAKPIDPAVMYATIIENVKKADVHRSREE